MGRRSSYTKSRMPSRRKKNRSLLSKRILKQKLAHNAQSQENPSHLLQASGSSTTVQANPLVSYDDNDGTLFGDSAKDNALTTCSTPMKDSEAEKLDCCDIEVEVSQDTTVQANPSVSHDDNDDTVFDDSSKENSLETTTPSKDSEAKKLDYCGMEVEVSYEQESTLSDISGRRIFDIQHLFAQLLNGKKHELYDCDLTDCILIREHRRGLYSEFLLKCKMCGITETITTEKCQQESTDKNINSSVAVAAISTGIGFSQIEELAATIDMPMMSSKTFNKYHDKVSETILTSAWSSMVEAGQEEAKLARDSGDIDSEGIPCITVVTDGAWCKRSYNVNYDASSGVACIIGYRTGKVLYLGVRNKYCTVCARSEHKGVEPPEHKCFKNWSGTSTAMETDIIVEGFKCSLEIHGLKYMKMIGDGDSSVHNKLLESRPYGHMLVQKIECKNHLLRNFSSNLREISARKRSNSKNMPVPYNLRKEVSARSMRLRTAITKAALHRMSEDISLTEKIKLLEVDIRNAPSHVFGEHAKCKELKYFKCNPTEEEVNLVPSMKLYGLYSDVEACLQRLIQNCSSLILNMDNNMAEHFNSIVCKFVGGKRINFSLKGSYQSRCEAAALSFNSGWDFHGKLHQAITGQSPTNLMKKYSLKMKKRRLQVKQRNQKRRMKVALPDKDYGPESNIQPLGVDDVEYIRLKEEFLEMLKKNPSEIEDIQRATIGQSGNPRWIQERSMRLTASHFGKICNMRQTTSSRNTVKNLLYSKFTGNQATRYGIANEPHAIRAFMDAYNVEVENCGLFIDDIDFYLAASPDGLVGEDSIIEVKCPSVISKISPLQGIVEKKLKFAVLDENNSMSLKRNHAYFYQVQGQLAITKRSFCYFVVWSPQGMLVEKIERDISFWKEKMLPKLKNFYFNKLLPELVDPQHPKGRLIRE